MSERSGIRRRICFVIACLLATPLTAAAEPAASGPERFTGVVVDLSGGVGLSTAPFTLHIDQYSNVEEINGHLAVLSEQGHDGLEKALRKLDRGWIRVGPSLGYPISVARSIETEEGRVIRVVTDRPIQMFEVMRGLRSQDYSLGMIEITIDSDGKGEGRLIAAAKAKFNKDGQVEIESLGTRPFRLLQVRQREIEKKD